MDKPQNFDKFVSLHLLDSNHSVIKKNINYVTSLLHLGSKIFFEKFMTFITTHASTHSTYDTEYLLLDLALRHGPRQKDWLKEFFKILSMPFPRIKSDALTERQIKEHFRQAVDRLPQEKRDKMVSLSQKKHIDLL